MEGNKIPRDLWKHAVLRFMTPVSLARLRAVSPYFKTLVEETMPQILLDLIRAGITTRDTWNYPFKQWFDWIQDPPEKVELADKYRICSRCAARLFKHRGKHQICHNQLCLFIHYMEERYKLCRCAFPKDCSYRKYHFVVAFPFLSSPALAL